MAEESSPPPELTRWLVSSGLLRFTQKKDSVDTIVQGRNASNKPGEIFTGWYHRYHHFKTGNTSNILTVLPVGNSTSFDLFKVY